MDICPIREDLLCRGALLEADRACSEHIAWYILRCEILRLFRPITVKNKNIRDF